jgi:hypothetical protein
VHRGREFEDAFKQLYHRNIKSRLHIRFINQYGQEEMGMDAGGLTKEFLTRIFKYLFDYLELHSVLNSADSLKTRRRSSCQILSTFRSRIVKLQGSMSLLEDFSVNHSTKTSCSVWNLRALSSTFWLTIKTVSMIYSKSILPFTKVFSTSWKWKKVCKIWSWLFNTRTIWQKER